LKIPLKKKNRNMVWRRVHFQLYIGQKNGRFYTFFIKREKMDCLHALPMCLLI
jgi:hypothetical protein